jgi:hypothetical protein
MIPGYDNGRDAVLNRQPVELPGGYSHYSVERSNGMEDITGVDANVRTDLNDFVYSFYKAVNNIFLAGSQTGLPTGGMVFTGTQVAVGEVADLHAE